MTPKHSFELLRLILLLCCWSASISAISSPNKALAAFVMGKSEGGSKATKTVELSALNNNDDNDRRRAIRNIILSNAMAAAAVTTVNSNANAISFNNNNNRKEVQPTTATDVAGNPITASSFLSKHKSGDRTLVQGLKGDPTYLIVRNQSTITKDESGNEIQQLSLTFEKYALNAECTHLGCIVPWDAMQSKFVCPCHGSQYAANGKLLRGPAPNSLKLAAVEVDATETTGGIGKVILSPWNDNDFRTGEKPWWV